MKRLVRLYHLYQVFFSLLLWVPVFYEFQRRMGLSDPAIFHIQSIYYLAFLLFEVPTGLLADRWSKRGCLILGAAVLVAANLLPVFLPTYWGFLLHFLAVALARSLASGASSAYLYERMAKAGHAAEFKGVEGRARAYGLVAKVVAWPAVGWLMERQVSLPYSLTAVAAGVALLVSFRLPVEAPQERGSGSQAGWGAFFGQFAEVGALLARSPALILVMIQGVAIFVLTRICQVNLFQPILESKAFTVTSYGVVLSVVSVFEAIGSAYPGWIRRWLSDLQAVYVLTGLLALSLALIPFAGPVGTVALLSVFSWVTGISFPVQRQLINDVIPDSRYRATFLSVESIIDRAASAGVAAVLGGVVAGGKLGWFLQLSAGVSFGLIFVLMLLFRRLEAAAVPTLPQER